MPGALDFKVKLTGFAELERMLEELPIKAARHVIRDDLHVVGEIWSKAMAALVRRGAHHGDSHRTPRLGKNGKPRPADDPEPAGFIAENIAIVIRTKDNLSATMSVGPSKKAFWAKWLEFGTGPRVRGNETLGRNLHGLARKIYQRYQSGDRMLFLLSGRHSTKRKVKFLKRCAFASANRS
jgi:hypothetical protein